MNVKEIQVTNAANLSMFMVNVSQALTSELSTPERRLSILDLKAVFRGRKYVLEILKYLPRPPERFLIDQLFPKVGLLGCINGLSNP